MLPISPSGARLARWEKKPPVGLACQPLDELTRPAVPTEQAAFYLNRRPQTLRSWACLENGPIRPLRIHGRLAWPVADIKRLLGVA
ncbi:hypothetical protein [Shinella sp.]|uniref:hypothetical protein n=1 Tax=Shinella sp. TaxID=1870904 RepID=UPI0039E2F3BD